MRNKNLVMNNDVVVCEGCYEEVQSDNILDSEDYILMGESTEPCEYCGEIPMEDAS